MNAGWKSCLTSCHATCGRCGLGSDDGTAPKREPIVSTGSFRIATAAVARIIATNGAGTLRDTLGQKTSTARVPVATPTAAGLTVGRARPSASHFSTKSAGTAPIESPRKSFTWELKMMTAIPDVKPVTTGYGMNLIRPPRRARPRAIRPMPAIKVQTTSPS